MPIWLPVVFKSDPKGLTDAQNSLDGFGKTLGGIGVAAGVAFAAASAAAVAFGASSLKAAAEAESIGRVMENAAKNAGTFGDAEGIKNATKALDEHSTKIAELTGIDDELFNKMKSGWLATPSLAALGTDGINNLAQVTADVAAGSGKDIETIGLAFQKMAGDSETALSKLNRAGIVLTDGQKATYQSLVDTGKEAEAQAYLIDTLGEKYKGAAQAAANPFERLKVIFENLQETVGAALMPAIEKLVPVVQNFIAKLTGNPQFEAFLVTLTTAFITLLDAVIPLLEPITNIVLALMPALMNIITALVPVILLLVQAFLPLIEGVLPILTELINMLLPIFTQLITDLIVPLIPIILMLVQAFMPLIEAVLPIIMELLQALMPILLVVAKIFSAVLTVAIGLFAGALQRLAPAVKVVADGIAGVFSWLASNISGILNWIIGAFEGFINFLADGVNKFVDPLNALLDGVRAVTGGAVDLRVNAAEHISLPRLANGGIVMPSPGGTIAQIGEAGKAEAVIPLDRLSSMMGSGGGGTSTVNITVNAGMGTDGAALGEQIVSAIRKYERTSGRVFVAA